VAQAAARRRSASHRDSLIALVNEATTRKFAHETAVKKKPD
jgi:hypothetical protein